MKALILGTGPSLNHCPHIDLDTGEVVSSGFVVIGMNDVPTRVACDWWVFADWASWWKWSEPDENAERSNIAHGGVIGSPKIFTKRDQSKEYERRRPRLDARGFDMTSREDAMARFAQLDFSPCAETVPVPSRVEACNNGTRYNVRQFTGSLAIMLAYYLRVDEVEAWGCEMSGDGAFNGRGGTRTDARWRFQLMVWGTWVEAFAVQGVKVYRADADGALHVDTGSPRMEHAVATRPGRWTYHNQHGRVTQTFVAANEQDFRRKLEPMLGRERAQKVKVEEVG